VHPLRPFVRGDGVRDWLLSTPAYGVFPYGEDLTPLVEDPHAAWWQHLWQCRTTLAQNKMFGGRTKVATGLKWFEWGRLTTEKMRTPLTIVNALVTTHNHFVLAHGPAVFSQGAPIIKLPPSATEDDHLRLLAILNSSTAGFWFRQVCQEKPGFDEAFDARLEFNASNVEEFPLPADRSADLPRRIGAVARERAGLLDAFTDGDLRAQVHHLKQRDAELFAQMVTLQEELDWQVMGAYGLVGEEVIGADVEAPPLVLGERAFELVLARQVAAGEVETSWFARHGAAPITELPARWPAGYRALVEQRVALIEEDVNVGLIERPEHKRRWSGVDAFADRLRHRLVALVLDRLEAEDVWAGEPRLRSVSELADVVRRDPQLAEACALIAGDPDADVGVAVRSLVLDEAVPFLAAWRHTDTGLRTRAVWERTWELQREEDAATTEAERAALPKIPVPPRYKPTDFRSVTSWRLRGKLDVPKERFVLVPGAERGAGAAEVLAWAGWDEATRARALAARVLELQSEDAAGADRLAPLLAGVLELLPWIHQWRPEPDPALGQPLGAFFEDWLDGMLAQLGVTRDALRDWRAPTPTRGRRRTATPST